MSASELVSTLVALAKLAEQVPGLTIAISHVFSCLQAGQDPTPAIKHAEALMAARVLGLDPLRV